MSNCVENIKITYVAKKGENPIQKLISAHCIKDESDFGVLLGFINIFSSDHWAISDLLELFCVGKVENDYEKISVEYLPLEGGDACESGQV